MTQALSPATENIVGSHGFAGVHGDREIYQFRRSTSLDVLYKSYAEYEFFACTVQYSGSQKMNAKDFNYKSRSSI